MGSGYESENALRVFRPFIVCHHPTIYFRNKEVLVRRVSAGKECEMKYLLAFTTFAVCAFLAFSARSQICCGQPPENVLKPWRVWASLQHGTKEEPIWFLQSHKDQVACRQHARDIYRTAVMEHNGRFPDPTTGQLLPITKVWCKADGFQA